MYEYLPPQKGIDRLITTSRKHIYERTTQSGLGWYIPKSIAHIPVPVPRSITRCGDLIGARNSFLCIMVSTISCTMSRRSDSLSSLGMR